ncbi:MAG: hypothetical protein D6690_03345 [Nitrospirae bacterium]|nr:MAG: hypothetical protein D6690_03345 [Nitrospirota bacterium]
MRAEPHQFYIAGTHRIVSRRISGTPTVFADRLPMHVICESLMIGNQYEAQAPPPFISGVLWAALAPTIVPPPVDVFARIPLREFTEPDPQDIHAGVAWLERHLPTHHILVGCREGKGRSASVVIAYLCCVRHMSYEDAVRFVQHRRPGATPLPCLKSCIDTVKRLRQNRASLATGLSRDRTD